MKLPQIGDRIRAGTVAEVIHIDPPNEVGNVRCIVRDDRGQLGWIVYYPDGSRSNVNFFPPEQAEEVRSRLDDLP